MANKSGPKTEAGKLRALENLRQHQQPGHGAYGVDADEPQVVVSRQVLAATIEAEIGDKLRPADRTLVSLLAVTLRRVELLEAHLDSKGMFQRGGEPRPALEALQKFLKLAKEYASELGMSPTGRSRLGIKDRAKSAAEAWAQAAADLEKEEKN